MQEQAPRKADYDTVMEKSAEVLQAVSIDGWSDRATPFAHDADSLLTESDKESYEEAGLLEDGEYTEMGESLQSELRGYINELKSQYPVVMENGASDVSGVRNTATGYRQSFEPEDDSPFFYTEKAGENIGLLTSKRGDTRRYNLFTTIAGSEQISQSRLNDIIDMSRGPVSRILGELEEEEMIDRHSPEGRNGKVVELTEQGEKLEDFVSDVEELVSERIK